MALNLQDLEVSEVILAQHPIFLEYIPLRVGVLLVLQHGRSF